MRPPARLDGVRGLVQRAAPAPHAGPVRPIPVRSGAVTPVSVGPRPPEPGTWIDRLAGAADLEVQLGAGTAPPIARRGDHLPRGDGLARPCSQPIVLAL